MFEGIKNWGRRSSATSDRDAIVEIARRLADVVNESLKIANESHNSDTKTSRLEFAKVKLRELKRLANAYPFLQLAQLDRVELDIQRLEVEFEVEGYREAADGNMRGQALEKAGKIDEALAVYEQLLSNGVDTPFTYRRLAILYSKLKKKEDERRVLETAIRNVPNSNSQHFDWFAKRLAKIS